MIDPNRKLVAPPFEFNEEQKKVFDSLLDTFVAELSPEEEAELIKEFESYGTHTKEQIQSFCRLSNSSLQNDEVIMAFLNRALAVDKRAEILLVLTLLSKKAGSLALTGHYNRFYDLTRQEREKVALKWKNSYLPPLRLLYKMFFSTSCHPAYGRIQSALHEGMQYPGTDDVRTHADYKPERTPERLPMLTVEELQQPDLKFDVIIIGSGAGGGVTAAELAKAGKKVLVIEKGKYHHEDDFKLHESSAFNDLYEYGGFFSTYEGTVNILAGSTFGGGTTVNWSASLKLQHFVREEWARQGLSHFVSPKFSEDLDRVFDRIGAKTSGVKHNGPNAILVKGCQELGYPVADLHQNTDGRDHECGFCFAGCRDGVKNGTMNSWLRDAHEHGAKFVDMSKVQRVLVENGKAVGVEVLAHYKHKINLRADQVVVAAGSLQTPGVLQRTGLTNKNIGQHLRIHPCCITFGFFDHDVDMFRGSIMTAVSNVAENVDHEGYGAKLEVPSLHPGSYSTVLPWRGAAQHKSLMLRYRRCAPMLILSRDKDSKGVVRYDKDNNMIVDFRLSTHDRRSLMEGIIRSLRVLAAAGAREVHTGQYGVDGFKFNKGEESRADNPRFEEWLKQVSRYGLPQDGAGVFAAHQMGSCRMGVTPKVSVAKPTGETWEVKDLFISDASLFPTASGVNPMVTTEAVALHVADSIIKSGSNAKL